ncbi:hypothetical protein KAJ27_14840 [bacterium]|nr:hypothetical protein [bacterium]
MKFPISKRKTQSIYFFLILSLLTLIYLYPLEEIVDIDLSGDEVSFYLVPGRGELKHLDIQYSPLYSTWYKLIYWMSDSSIQMYYLNLKVLSFLIPLLTFILLIILNTDVLFSFILSVVILISSGNVNIFPKVNHFCLVFALAVMIIFQLKIFRDYFLHLFLIVFWCASYIRPEMTVSFIILNLYSIVSMIIGKQSRWKTLIFVMIILIGLMYFFGFPLKGNRTEFAFSQHYALNWVNWNDSDQSAWWNYNSIMDKEFGKLCSPFEAFLIDKKKFFKHVMSNVLKTPNKILRLLICHPVILFPYKLREVEYYLIFLIFLIFAFRLKHHSWFTKLDIFEGYILLFVSPFLLGAFGIYPQASYLIVPAVLLSIILFKRVFPQKKEYSAKIFIIPLIFIIFIPKPEPLVGKRYQYRKSFEYVNQQLKGVRGQVLVKEKQDIGGRSNIFINHDCYSITSLNDSLDKVIQDNNIKAALLYGFIQNHEREKIRRAFIHVYGKENIIETLIPETKNLLIYVILGK